jgi:hypothetical protein
MVQARDFQAEIPGGLVHPSHDLAPPSSLSHNSAIASAQNAQAINFPAFASEQESWQNP